MSRRGACILQSHPTTLLKSGTQPSILDGPPPTPMAEKGLKNREDPFPHKTRLLPA